MGEAIITRRGGSGEVISGGVIVEFDNFIPSNIDPPDEEFIHSTPTTLSVARQSLTGASVGNYALFAGGHNSSSIVDAYDTSLTRSTPTALSVGRYSPAGASVGNYALFAGGYSSYPPNRDTVDAYDTSLTRSIPTVLSVARRDLAGASVGNYVLFAGGYVSSSQYKDTVDAYDISLTRSTPAALSVARNSLAGASVGNYALFAGGRSDSLDGNISDVVDAYTSPVPEAILYMPIGTKYKFGKSEETATTNKITVSVPLTGYIKYKSGVVGT